MRRAVVVLCAVGVMAVGCSSDAAERADQLGDVQVHARAAEDTGVIASVRDFGDLTITHRLPRLTDGSLSRWLRVELADGRVGWVFDADGRQSSAVDLPVAWSTGRSVTINTEVSLHLSPREDSPTVGRPLRAMRTALVTGRSADSQWLLGHRDGRDPLAWFRYDDVAIQLHGEITDFPVVTDAPVVEFDPRSAMGPLIHEANIGTVLVDLADETGRYRAMVAVMDTVPAEGGGVVGLDGEGGRRLLLVDNERGEAMIFTRLVREESCPALEWLPDGRLRVEQPSC